MIINAKKCPQVAIVQINARFQLYHNNFLLLQSYSEGSSLSGLFFNELISFGDNFKSVSFPIGCTTRETHLFLTQHADGIMGLSNSDSK